MRTGLPDASESNRLQAPSAWRRRARAAHRLGGTAYPQGRRLPEQSQARPASPHRNGDYLACFIGAQPPRLKALPTNAGEVYAYLRMKRATLVGTKRAFAAWSAAYRDFVRPVPQLLNTAGRVERPYTRLLTLMGGGWVSFAPAGLGATKADTRFRFARANCLA